MPRSRGVNLLVVKADGRRLLRVTLRPWALGLGMGVVALIAASLGAIYGDYLSLRQQRASLAAIQPRLAEQERLVAAYQGRVREMRAEIDGWRDVHARIWEPFGPEANPAKRGAGIGGGSAPSPLEAGPGRADVRDELERVATMVMEEGENLRSLERFLSRAGKLLASLPSRWPLRGPVNSDFGRRRSPWTSTAEFHSGMDIGAPVGTPVRAPAPGTVVFAGRHPEYGIALVVDHGHDTKSLYGHLSKLSVALNQQVARGDLLALSGNTGRSSGPHLHYEIQVKGQPVNPSTYIWE